MAATLVRAAVRDVRPALLAVPGGAVLAAALAGTRTWPPTAWLLVLALLAGPVALAYRAGTARAWSAVAVFALAGIATGYGLLDPLLGRAVGEGGSSLATGVAAAGGAVAVATYGWLLAQPPSRR